MASSAIPAHTKWFTVNCPSGKRSYADRRAAKEAAKLLAKKGLGNMRPYLCRHCENIHIAHPLI